MIIYFLLTRSSRLTAARGLSVSTCRSSRLAAPLAPARPSRRPPLPRGGAGRTRSGWSGAGRGGHAAHGPWRTEVLPGGRGALLSACVALWGIVAPLRTNLQFADLSPRGGGGRDGGAGGQAGRPAGAVPAAGAGRGVRGAQVSADGPRRDAGSGPPGSLPNLCYIPQRQRAQQHVLREGDGGQAAPGLRHPPPARFRR